MPYPYMQVADAAEKAGESYIHFSHQGGDAPLSLVQFGWHHTPKAYGYGPMVRDHCLIHFVVKGKGRAWASDMEYHVGPGECFAIFPHQITYYESDPEDPWEYYWLGFEGQWSQELLKAAGFLEEMIVRPILEEEKLFEMMKKGIGLGMRADNALYLSGLMHQILHHLISHPSPMQARQDSSRRRYMPLGNEYVRIVSSIIATSFRERLSVDEMASRMGLNRSYLTTLFKEYTGISIKEYLTEYRLQKSILKLQDAAYTVKQAALECGFTDPLYYSRMFKARYGMPPREYRSTRQEDAGLEEAGIADSVQPTDEHGKVWL